MTLSPKLGTLQELITFLKDSQFTHISQNKYTLYCKKSKEAKLINNESFTTYIENFKKLFGKTGIFIPSIDIIETKEFRWLSLTPSKKAIEKEALSSMSGLEIDLSKLIHKDCSLFASICLEHNITTFVASKVNTCYDLNKPFLAIENNNLNLADREEFSKPYKNVKKGDWSLIQHHLMNLTGEEIKMYDHIIQLYARKLRNPLVKDNDQTIIFYDRGGTGKSLWFQILDELNGNISGLVKPEERIYMPNFHKTKFSYMSEIDHLGSPSVIMGRVKILTEALVIRNRKNIAEESITNFNLIHIATNNLGWLEAETSKRRWVLAEGGSLKLEEYLASKGISDKLASEYLNGINSLKFNNPNKLITDQVSAFVYYLMNEVEIKEDISLVKSELYNQVFEAKETQYENHPFNIFLNNILKADDIKGVSKAWFDSYSGKQTIDEALLLKKLEDSIEKENLIISNKSIKISNTLLRDLFQCGETMENFKKASFTYFCKICNIDNRKNYKASKEKLIKGQTFKKEQE